MFKKRFCLFLVAVWVMVSPGCSLEEEPVVVDMSQREDITVKKEVQGLTYAYLPQYSHRTSYERHHRLIEYLHRETDLNIIQIFPDTFDVHMKMVGQGKIDISFSNPFVYVQMAKQYGSRAFARIIEPDGTKDFRGLIICRADNPQIRQLQDCKAKRWLAVDPSSAGGYLFGLGHFIQHGIQKADFHEIAFARGSGGMQEKVVLAVHAGRYDIGTVREGALEVVANKINLGEIKILAHTRYYPGWVYSARKGLPPQVVERIKQAFLRLDRNNAGHREILQAANFKGVVSSDDREFEPVRELVTRVGLGRGEFNAEIGAQ